MGENIGTTAGGVEPGVVIDANGAGNQQGLQNKGVNSAGAQNNTKAAENASQGGKTYSEKELQAETDKRVTEAIKTAQAKWQKEYEEKLENEKAEAARLAKMNADERAKAEFENQVKQFNEQQEKYNSERLTFECTRQLASESLPVEFADMLTGKDSESTLKNIETFKNAFSKAIEAAVTERLKGTTPKGTNAIPETKEADAFLAGFGG